MSLDNLYDLFDALFDLCQRTPWYRPFERARRRGQYQALAAVIRITESQLADYGGAHCEVDDGPKEYLN